jgi:hypothetical protein
MKVDRVELKKIAGRYRTIISGTRVTLAKNQAGTAIDGGGWSEKDRATGERQVMHVNESLSRKRHGRI